MSLAALALTLSLTVPGAPPLRDGLANADFARWTGDAPDGWTRIEGAHTADGPWASLASLGPAGGLVVEGDARTGRWPFLQQDVAVPGGATVLLSYEARLVEERLEPGQFDCAWVLVDFLDAGGAQVGRGTGMVGADFEARTLLARAPASASTARVAVFLAHTGRLEVRRVALRTPPPSESFALLTSEMDRWYSHFEAKGVDWPALVAAWRPRLAEETDPARFAAGLSEMLATLRDGHVWIDPPGGRRLVPYAPSVAANADFRAVARGLQDLRTFGRLGFVGRTSEGYGYAAVGGFQGTDEEWAAFEAAFEALLDAPALIVDVRGNGGGEEARGQRLAGRLTGAPLVYARQRYRAGPEHGDFGPTTARRLEPVGERPYPGVVVALVGGGAVSSGEGFAQMLAALPDVPLLGQPTRGSSGNPAPVALPNGVDVWFSRWQSLTPDGAPIEDRGILPDVALPFEPGPAGGDPTFDAARAEAAARLAARRR